MTREMDRWRINEVKYFDGDTTSNLYAFVDRLNSVVVIETPGLILFSIVTCFMKRTSSNLSKKATVGRSQSSEIRAVKT